MNPDKPTALILLNMGGPDSLKAVQPFLYNLFSDRDLIQLPAGSLLQKPFAWLISQLRAPMVRANYASIGGKTAINVPGGKNLVGAFHQPVLVAVDPTCLATLDTRDIRAGIAESIKHALISSPEFLDWHEQNADTLLSLEQAKITELIRRNVQIKADVVVRDAREESGLRMRM